MPRVDVSLLVSFECHCRVSIENWDGIARAYFSLLMPSKYMFVSDKIISDMKIKEPCYLDRLMFLGYLFQHATDQSYSSWKRFLFCSLQGSFDRCKSYPHSRIWCHIMLFRFFTILMFIASVAPFSRHWRVDDVYANNSSAIMTCWMRTKSFGCCMLSTFRNICARYNLLIHC